MKLVTQFVDPGDAAEVSARLRAAGIMTEVAGLDPHIVKPSKSGATRIGLWVVSDDQFEDALRLLENPSHLPKPVDSGAEMENASISGAGKLPRLKAVRTAVIFILGAFLLGLIVFGVSGIEMHYP